MTTPLIPLVALLFSSLAILLLRRPAVALGLADIPGGRKQHQGIIPLTGGLGVFIGFLLVQPLLSLPLGQLLPLYVGLVVLVMCGVIDDARDMRSTVKLAVQLAVAALMVLWGQQVLIYLGDFPLLGDVYLGWVAVPITIIAVAGLINAVNMMDGVDGLAGGSALSVLGWLALVAVLQSQLVLFAVIITLASSLVGFLIFNLRHPWRSKASVFMGDAGSMALGFAIAWFVVELSQSPNALISPIAYGWLVALPVMDTLSLMVRRLRKRRSPFSADRDHLHHIFLRAGFTPGQTTLILMLVVATLGGIGVVLSLADVPDELLLIGLLLMFVLHAVFVAYAWQTSKALRRLHRATLGREHHPAATQMIRLRRSEQIGKGRRQISLVGLYLMALSIGFDSRLTLLGGAMAVAAALLSYPLFWRDVLRLKVFWISLLLTLYVLVRGLISGELLFSIEAFPWWGLAAITGLISLPIAWWLAQYRLHWNWLVLALVLGGGFSFMLHADWNRLELGDFATPQAWGAPAHVGFMTSLGLVMLLAMLFVGLQRLGKGWRPAAQVALAILLSVPSVMVLMGTGYVTAWLATVMGGTVYVLASPVLGKHQGYRLGRLGLGSLLGITLIGVLTHDLFIMTDVSLVQRLVEPLQAVGLVLSGKLDEARVLHAGVVERLMLWGNAWEGFRANWFTGTGYLTPAIEGQELAGYRGYASLFASVASGLGAVGLVGFAVVVLLPFKALVWTSLNRHWHAVWGLGILSCGITICVFCLLAMPLHSPASVSLIVLIISAAQVAIFQHSWIMNRKVVKESLESKNSFSEAKLLNNEPKQPKSTLSQRDKTW